MKFERGGNGFDFAALDQTHKLFINLRMATWSSTERGKAQQMPAV